MGRDLQPKIMDRMITSAYVTQIMDPSLKDDQQIPVEEVMDVVLLVSRCRMTEREKSLIVSRQLRTDNNLFFYSVN